MAGTIWLWAAVAVMVMGLATPVIAYKKNRPVFLWLALGALWRRFLSSTSCSCRPGRARLTGRLPRRARCG